MGNQPGIAPQAKTLANNETEVLNQATSIVQQLKLFHSQAQLRDQRHLVARILLYGHSHLVAHLNKFTRDQQLEGLRYLRSIDYETLDLLYQNLVLSKAKEKKSKIVYEQYNGFINKTKQSVKNNQKYAQAESQGRELLQSRKVAVLLFAGGASSRFKNQQHQSLPKEIYTQQPDQQCLLQIALEKLSAKVNEYKELPVYLVHNEANHNRLNQILAKYPNLKPKKILQNEYPIVNLSGKICLKSADSFDIMASPRGCGDLPNMSIRGHKLFQEMKNDGISYVITSGVENICSLVVDPYLVGVLAHSPEASCAFKCTYPDNQNQNIRRVVYNPAAKCLEALQLESLLVKTDLKSESVIKRSPVWMNSLVLRIDKVQAYLNKKKQSLSMAQLFSAQKIQSSYWNPSTDSYNQLQHCYTFERELSDLLLNQELRSIGVMTDREKQFMPVYTLNGEKSWAEAYNHYIYQKKNQQSDKNLVFRSVFQILKAEQM